MTTKPLYILIKLDVDAEIVTKDNVETYVKNHCNALEYEWEDYMLGSEEHPNLRINEEEIWIEGERDLTDEEIWNNADLKEVWP